MSKTRVFIYGSCVSRDTFEYLDPDQFEIVQYVARQSALSAYTRPVTLVDPPTLELLEMFVNQGFNERTGWMHTSSGVDNVDEFAQTIEKRGDGFCYRYGKDCRPLVRNSVAIRYRTADGKEREWFAVGLAAQALIRRIRRKNGKRPSP